MAVEKKYFEVNKEVILNLSIPKLLELKEQCEEVLKHPTSVIYDVAIDMEKLVKKLLTEKNYGN